MTDSIMKKVKGLFMSKKTKVKETDGGGFGVLNSSQAPDPAENSDKLDSRGASEGETLREPTGASDSISEKTEEIESKAEKAHEKVSRIAAEKNTKGYGL